MDELFRPREAVVVEAVRTPVGRRGGALAGWHPVDLLGFTLAELVSRAGIDPALIDDVIAGCVSQVGEQGVNVGRNAVLAAGFPESVCGTTVDRQCGSSQQAAHFAAQGIVAGAYDVAIACGVESMTRVPLGSNAQGPGKPFGPMMSERYKGGLVNQGISAEMIAEGRHLSRAALDAYSLESHRRAAAAQDAGYFAAQIAPVPIVVEDDSAGVFSRDEGIRRDTTLEKLGSLKPAFKADGVVTAGNASQISDGAAALLVVEARVAKRLGLRPRARFAGFAVAGDDPILMLTAPIPATARILERTGVKLEDVERIELNEAFASVVLAWQQATGADLARVNVNGGAIALGHPLGASGARIMTDLVFDLERSGARYGLQLMCEGGGMANATLLERWE
jgi:acetyl-CoA acetyltransferase family protein